MLRINHIENKVGGGMTEVLSLYIVLSLLLCCLKLKINCANENLFSNLQMIYAEQSEFDPFL